MLYSHLPPPLEINNRYLALPLYTFKQKEKFTRCITQYIQEYLNSRFYHYYSILYHNS